MTIKKMLQRKQKEIMILQQNIYLIKEWWEFPTPYPGAIDFPQHNPIAPPPTPTSTLAPTPTLVMTISLSLSSLPP